MQKRSTEPLVNPQAVHLHLDLFLQLNLCFLQLLDIKHRINIITEQAAKVDSAAGQSSSCSPSPRSLPPASPLFPAAPRYQT